MIDHIKSVFHLWSLIWTQNVGVGNMFAVQKNVQRLRFEFAGLRVIMDARISSRAFIRTQERTKADCTTTQTLLKNMWKIVSRMREKEA